MSLYLDTSVLLPTLIAEPSTEAVYDYLGAIDQELLISDFAAAEVASGLSRRKLGGAGSHSGARYCASKVEKPVPSYHHREPSRHVILLDRNSNKMPI